MPVGSTFAAREQNSRVHVIGDKKPLVAPACTPSLISKIDLHREEDRRANWVQSSQHRGPRHCQVRVANGRCYQPKRASLSKRRDDLVFGECRQEAGNAFDRDMWASFRAMARPRTTKRLIPFSRESISRESHSESFSHGHKWNPQRFRRADQRPPIY
jgi:hypothetical protein